jgi:biotin carboxyl carrier protein
MAANKLEKEGIEAEVLDLRSLRPLDVDAILATVRKTNRAVVLEEGWPYVGIGSQIVSIIQDEAFDDLDAPVLRVTQADVPMPYAKNLEQLAKPSADRVVEACNRVLSGADPAARGAALNQPNDARTGGGRGESVPERKEAEMATKVHMEALSPTMEEGQVVKWLKSEGDEVTNGEILAEIETDKATMELVARGEGSSADPAGEGSTAPVGEVIAVIAAADEDISEFVEEGGGAPGIRRGAGKTRTPGSRRKGEGEGRPTRRGDSEAGWRRPEEAERRSRGTSRSRGRPEAGCKPPLPGPRDGRVKASPLAPAPGGGRGGARPPSRVPAPGAGS